MALDESHRRELFEKLDTTLGPRPAATLMAHLPPVGWADVATKHDLHELERRIDMRFEMVDRRFASVEGRLDSVEARLERVELTITQMAIDWRTELVKQSRALFLSLATMTLGGISLAFAAARFGG